jgi:predicted  nucleic acid-binding Zn-ribbon protein
LGVSGEPGAAETAELTARVQAARSEFDDLRTRIVELPVYAEITEIASQVEELDSTVQSLRNRGYAFQTELEDKIKELGQLWEQTQAQVTLPGSQSATLMRAYRPATSRKPWEEPRRRRAQASVSRCMARSSSSVDAKERYAGLGTTVASVRITSRACFGR